MLFQLHSVSRQLVLPRAHLQGIALCELIPWLLNILMSPFHMIQSRYKSCSNRCHNHVTNESVLKKGFIINKCITFNEPTSWLLIRIVVITVALFNKCEYYISYLHTFSYGHTCVKAPGPVRSPKLSTQWPGQ